MVQQMAHIKQRQPQSRGDTSTHEHRRLNVGYDSVLPCGTYHDQNTDPTSPSFDIRYSKGPPSTAITVTAIRRLTHWFPYILSLLTMTCTTFLYFHSALHTGSHMLSPDTTPHTHIFRSARIFIRCLTPISSTDSLWRSSRVVYVLS